MSAIRPATSEGGASKPSFCRCRKLSSSGRSSTADARTVSCMRTDTGYVFVLEDGQHLDPRRVSKEFQRQSTAAALPRIPLHGLRHTCATMALSSPVNPRIVSGRLGHSTVALTLDIYSHVLPQADQDAADRIAALIEL
jgi:integrase